MKVSPTESQACFRGGFRFWNQKSFIWSFGAHISSWETASTVGKVGKLFPFKDKNELLSIQRQKRLSIQRLKTIFLSSQFDIEFCAFLRFNYAGKFENK